MIINYYLGWGCLDGWDQVVEALVLLDLAENSVPSRRPWYLHLSNIRRRPGRTLCMWISKACGKMSPAALVSTMENGGLGFS